MNNTGKYYNPEREAFERRWVRSYGDMYISQSGQLMQKASGNLADLPITGIKISPRVGVVASHRNYYE